MEEDLDDCSCNWYCSCKVLLGKRSVPEYLKIKEYQDFIRSSPTKLGSTSSRRTERRFGSAELGGLDDLVSVVNPNPDLGTVSTSTHDIQGRQQGPYQTENGVNTLAKKSTLDGQSSSTPNGTAASETGPKLINTNGSRNISAMGNKLNNGTDKSNQNTKISNSIGVNGGQESTSGENNAAPARSGYNCRNRSLFHKCSTCGKMFGQKTSLQMHEKEHVLESSKHHQCNETGCGKLYATVASYERHLKTSHPKCLLCKKSLTLKQVENQPEEEIGINQVNLCKKCRKNDAPVVKRRKSHHSTDMNGTAGLPTTESGHREPFEIYDTNTDENDASLMNGNGSGGYLEEENYGQEFPNDGILGTGGDMILFCDYCGAMFDCSEDFYPHYQEHGKHEFECRYCLLPFSNSEEVFIHEQNHADRRWNCLFCPIKFRSQSEREIHERFHT